MNLRSILIVLTLISGNLALLFGQCPTSYTSDAGGDFASTANWAGDVAPPNPIPPGVTVTINHAMTNNGILENNGTIIVNSPGSFTNLTGATYRGNGTFTGNFINNGTVAPGSTVVLPTLSTTVVTSIAGISAISGGTISNDGGETLSARGVCWSTSPDPTISLPTKTSDAGNPFVSNITGLTERTTYYVRAYATNSAGTAYGNELTFTTNCGPVTFTYNGSTVTYGTAFSAGRCWLDRNLGAGQVATASDDAAAYGDIFQWGRLDDGHQLRSSSTTNIVSNSDNPGHNMYILSNGLSYWDWRSPANDNLWQGLYGINNPCPDGFRVPVIEEWNAESMSWGSTGSDGAFNSPLRLTLAGFRDPELQQDVVFDGISGYYYSSSIYGLGSESLIINSNNNFISQHLRGFGRSVRCIKDDGPAGSIGSLDCSGATMTGTLTEGVTASGVSASIPYTGGNGGSHAGQTVTSTGITGLTAYLYPGVFNNGAGNLIYSISGTPLGSGTATFALNIGGQSCNMNMTVAPGSLASLNCSGATITGTLINGVAASGVSASVPYTGGNGGSHNGQTVGSTGITGLTATTSAGNFANGNGSLIYTITGTPSCPGYANFALNIGGQSCNLRVLVNCSTTSVTFTYKGSSVTYGVVPGAESRCWLDRNLGASQVATSSTDAASYGDLFQWGRLDDGHQVRTSPTTTTLSNSDVPEHNMFIKTPNYPYDWRSPQNNNLWQGEGGTNNPCPDGYRLPTKAEWDAERASWSTNNAAGAFNSPLKMPMAGYCNYFVGTVDNEGSYGYYWSSTVSGTHSWYLHFYSGNANMSNDKRAYGFSVRCIKD